MKKAVFVMVLCVTVLSANAQFRAVNRLSFETNMGFSLVHGDVAPSAINVGMQLGTAFAFLRSMSLCGAVNYATLSSTGDKYGRSFSGSVVGFQVDYEINIPQLLTDYPQTFPVSPYIRFGAGYDIAQINSLNFAGIGAPIYPESPTAIMAQSYKSLTIPTTIGAFFRLNSYADINLKINYVYVDSDMVDGHQPVIIGNQYNDSYSMILVGVRMKSWDRRKPHITGR
ncbi:MAG: hypothetical protein HYZ16_00670 [Bacteroidetes bacterium]|nr:hypothetical protein [Bacteroidota bacterium]